MFAYYVLYQISTCAKCIESIKLLNLNISGYIVVYTLDIFNEKVCVFTTD